MNERISTGFGIRVDGRHASIADLAWQDIPRFSVLTGLNGAGKSQLLEIIAASTGALRNRDEVKASANFEGDNFGQGEVFHSYGEWLPQKSAPADEDAIRRAIERLLATRLGNSAELARELGVSSDYLGRLTPREFLGHLSPGLLWSYEPIDSQTLSFLFMAYRFLERGALASNEASTAWQARLGEPPWQVMSSVIKAAGLNFTFNIPAELPIRKFTTNERFEFELRDMEGRVVPFDRLSSGERVLMSTAVWRCESEIAGKQYRLLLLDEPDAHLHPALTRRFLNIIKAAFVEERQVRVIMTTHSPTTVALVPKDSLFEMTRTSPRIQVSTRENAIAVLTEGFVAVQDATRTVMLEGKGDPPFYRLVWRMLTEPLPDGRRNVLDPYPNINFVRGQGRQTVQELVPQMRDAGFVNVFGIIDRDSDNSPTDSVYILGRRAIENYLYDPLVIWLALTRRGLAPAIAGLTRQGLALGSQETLQLIIATIVSKMEKHFQPDVTEPVAVLHTNRMVLKYPSWCVTLHKRNLKILYTKAFTQFATEELLEAFSDANLIPQELADLLKLVQAASNGRSRAD